MRLRKLGNVKEFTLEGPKIVQVGKKAIGIYHHEGKFYAYENVCPHEGGPACEGMTIGNMEWEKAPGESPQFREFLSPVNMNIACPWHGVEYDLKTGVCRANKKLRLKQFQVRVRNGLLEIQL